MAPDAIEWVGQRHFGSIAGHIAPFNYHFFIEKKSTCQYPMKHGNSAARGDGKHDSISNAMLLNKHSNTSGESFCEVFVKVFC